MGDLSAGSFSSAASNLGSASSRRLAKPTGTSGSSGQAGFNTQADFRTRAGNKIQPGTRTQSGPAAFRAANGKAASARLTATKPVATDLGGASPETAHISLAAGKNRLVSFAAEPSGWFSRNWKKLAGTLSDMFSGAVLGSYSANQNGAVLAGQVVTGLIPVVGQAADTRDTVSAFQRLKRGEAGAGLGLGLALAGWIPLAGDWIKTSGKAFGLRAFDAVQNGAGWVKQSSASFLDAAGEAAVKFKHKWFYTPEIKATPLLPPGVGQTDGFGNVLYSSLGSASEQELVRQHELAHSFFSPKFLPLREFRAEAGMTAYSNSSLCRYLEEALAESYAQLRVNGISALPEGLKFPLTNGYVEIKDVVTEAAIGTIAIGGVSYGVFVSVDPEPLESETLAAADNSAASLIQAAAEKSAIIDGGE